MPGLAGLFFYLMRIMNKETKNIKKLIIDQSLELDCGKTIKDFPLAYETYGTLNKSKTNAILVFHALSGDQFVTNINPITKREGWWTTAVGSGKAIDTDKFFVICVNVLGGCMGSFGPKEINPETNELFATTFPVITIKDMVSAQTHLLDFLGIKKTLSVLGGSMGGMQALQFCSLYPERTFSSVPIACAASHSAQNIAFNELARQAIMADPNWDSGNYFLSGKVPRNGLAVARMAGHISYLSEQGLQSRFGRKLQEGDGLNFSFDADFQVESYLRHQGDAFSKTFDANTYLLMTKVLDYFDPADEFDGDLVTAFKPILAQALVLSFSSDWRFSPSRSREVTNALINAKKKVSHIEIDSPLGHDSFLFPEERYVEVLKAFLGNQS